jgi:hypothetical protein
VRGWWCRRTHHVLRLGRQLLLHGGLLLQRVRGGQLAVQLLPGGLRAGGEGAVRGPCCCGSCLVGAGAIRQPGSKPRRTQLRPLFIRHQAACKLRRRSQGAHRPAHPGPNQRWQWPAPTCCLLLISFVRLLFLLAKRVVSRLIWSRFLLAKRK